MNFSFLHYETTKLGPQRITVKCSKASKPPLLAVSSIILGLSQVSVQKDKVGVNVKREDLRTGVMNPISFEIYTGFQVKFGS